MPLPETLRKLLTAPGPSGYEQAPAAVFRDAAAAFAEITFDSVGSSVARVRGTGDGPFVAVVGHIDEIGLIVTHVDESGYVFFRGVGGWSGEVLRGQRVEILTRDGSIPGVVERARQRLRHGQEPQRTELLDLHIDIGARDGDDAKRLVRNGDVAVIAGEPVELHVLAEHALEQLGVRGRLARIEWEDGLLLPTEVLDRVPEEGIDVRGACLEPVDGAAARGGSDDAPQPASSNWSSS